MPTDFAAETARMAEAFGLVAAGAVPAGVAGWWLARRSDTSVLPPCRRPTAGWKGSDVLALFLLNFVLGTLAVVGLSQVGFFQAVYGTDFPPLNLHPLSPDLLAAVGGGAGGSAVQGRMADANAVRSLWGALVAVPLLIAAAGGLWVLGHGRRPSIDLNRFPGDTATGVSTWLILAPVVLGLNFAATWAMEASGSAPEEHPFTRIDLTGRPGTTALFAVVACGLAPLAEEVLFRGLLVGWATARRTRPWVVLAGGLLIAAVMDGVPTLSPPTAGRAVFWFGLIFGLTILSRRRRPARVAVAVFSAAAAFGLAHPWWPTPIPLFVFGFGLGCLFVRTGGLVAPVVAHGLFNAVSFVYLWRGGAGGV